MVRQMKETLGGLSGVESVTKLTVFVASAEGFGKQYLALTALPSY